MNGTERVLRLKELQLQRHGRTVELPNGRTIPVQFKVGALKAEIHASGLPAGPEQELAYLDLVRRVAPDATEEELDDLEPAECLAIIAQAKGNLPEVLEHIQGLMEEAEGTEGNAEAPAPPRKGRRRSPRSTH